MFTRTIRATTRPHTISSTHPASSLLSVTPTTTTSNSQQRDINTVSTVPSSVFQPYLSRLPIPELEVSVAKYLTSVSAIQSPEEHAATKKAADQFLQSGQGKSLQDELIQRDQNDLENSYITPFWDHMYFSERSPVAINSNPFLQYNDDPRGGLMGKQENRVAALVASMVEMSHAIDNDTLAPEAFPSAPTDEFFDSILFKMAKAVPITLPVQGQKVSTPLLYAYSKQVYPLDMTQFSRLFGTTRIPQQDKDVMYQGFNKHQHGSKHSHVMVMANNHIYRMEVVDNNTASGIRAQDDIAANLKQIHDHAYGQQPGLPLGALTAQERNTWADVRARMTANPINKESMQIIDDALFTVSLDNNQLGDDFTTASHQFLHGLDFGGNRWFDKSFNLIADANGKSAVNFEHSWGDGVCVLRMVNETFADSVSRTPPNAENGSVDEIQQLKFDFSSTDVNDIQEAHQRLSHQVDTMDFCPREFDDFGKAALKSAKVSPDGIIQLALQLAYRRHWGESVSTYESASTSAFKAGRTETIRPCTPQAVAFTSAMIDDNASDDMRLKLLREAVKAHDANKLDCSMGKGFDRHLFALKNIAQEHGDLPAIFADPGYAKINHNILSTSTLVSEAIEGGGFGPVVADGYGIGYGALDDRMRFNITSYGKQTEEFQDHIGQSLHAIRDMLHHVAEEETTTE